MLEALSDFKLRHVTLNPRNAILILSHPKCLRVICMLNIWTLPFRNGSNKDNSEGKIFSIYKYPKGISLWFQISVMHLLALTSMHELQRQLAAPHIQLCKVIEPQRGYPKLKLPTSSQIIQSRQQNTYLTISAVHHICK